MSLKYDSHKRLHDLLCSLRPSFNSPRLCLTFCRSFYTTRMYKVIYFKTPMTEVNVSRFFKILQGDKFSLNVNLLGSNHFNKIEISRDFDLNGRFVSSSRS